MCQSLDETGQTESGEGEPFAPAGQPRRRLVGAVVGRAVFNYANPTPFRIFFSWGYSFQGIGTFRKETWGTL